MATFREAVERGARIAFCRIADVFLDAYAAALGNSDNPYNQGYSAFNSGYSLACDRPPVPPADPPFAGGQCPGVLYRVTIRYIIRECSNNNVLVDETSVLPANYPGPIRGIIATPANTSCTPGGAPFSFELSYGNGQLSGPVATGNSSGRYECRVVSVTRVDGQPDSCGSPPPDRPNLPAPPETEPVTFDDPDGNPITVPVTFNFGFAYIDADLNVHIPIDVDVDFDIPVSFRLDFNLHTGDYTYNPSSPASPQPPPRRDTPDGYGTPQPPPPPTTVPPEYQPPENDEDTVETETIIRGVIVRVTQLPQDVNVWFNDGMPDLYYPRLGNVSFYVRVGNAFAWTEFVSVTATEQILQCPWEGGAIAVRASWYGGVSGDLYPVFRRGEQGYTFSL